MMATERGGFALLSVLWVVMALSTLMLTAVVPLSVARQSAENRAALIRARWAARACLDLHRVRSAAGRRPAPLDSIALGPTVWCRLSSERPDERVNPNHTDSVGLARALGDPNLAAAVLDWLDSDNTPRDGGAERDWYRARGRPTPRNGPFAHAREMGLVRGFEATAPHELDAAFTVAGDGSVSPNRAPRWALESISGLPRNLIPGIMTARRSQTFENAEQVVAILGTEPTIPEFRTMSMRFSFEDSRDFLVAEGAVDIGRAVLRAEVAAEVLVEGDQARLLDVQIR